MIDIYALASADPLHLLGRRETADRIVGPGRQIDIHHLAVGRPSRPLGQVNEG
jgi:hypothetical protein